MDYISFGGIKDGEEEYQAVERVMRSGWHTSGEEAYKLEEDIVKYTGAKYCSTVNSGSSANLLALAALDLPKGSKVLTSLCGFPATLNPIIHLGLEPVLVDYHVPSHNIDLDQIEKAVNENDIKAIIFAHTLGNPLDLDRLESIVEGKGIAVIEDCCEALGSRFDGQHVGTRFDFGTFSFYPSHQINGLGMGGAVVTNNIDHQVRIKSLRAWGKAVRSDKFGGDHLTNYDFEIDGIPYDDQFFYTTCGWNMLFPDTAAAYTRVQMTRLEGFVEQRRKNWSYLNENLNSDNYIPMEVHPKSEPSYFGYAYTLKEKENRDRMSDWLIENRVKTRPFFAGNITRHPAYRSLYEPSKVADFLMRNSMFFGVWHGLVEDDMQHISDVISKFK